MLVLLLYYACTQALKAVLGAVGGEGRVDVDGVVAAVAALGFVQGACGTDVIRGALLAILAARSRRRGPSARHGPRFRCMVVAGMLPAALPGLSNHRLSLVTDTAPVSVVACAELFFPTGRAAASTRA